MEICHMLINLSEKNSFSKFHEYYSAFIHSPQQIQCYFEKKIKPKKKKCYLEKSEDSEEQPWVKL